GLVFSHSGCAFAAWSIASRASLSVADATRTNSWPVAASVTPRVSRSAPWRHWPLINSPVGTVISRGPAVTVAKNSGFEVFCAVLFSAVVAISPLCHWASPSATGRARSSTGSYVAGHAVALPCDRLQDD